MYVHSQQFQSFESEPLLYMMCIISQHLKIVIKSTYSVLLLLLLLVLLLLVLLLFSSSSLLEEVGGKAYGFERRLT
jgi:hypothetical protein